MKAKTIVAVVAVVLLAGWLAGTARADGLRVAVWGDEDIRLTDIVVKVNGAGSFASVDAVNLTTQGVPTLAQAMNYDSILIYGGKNEWGSQVSTTAGNVLADYADAGRGVVVCTFVLGSNLSSWILKGRWDDSSRYYVMVPTPSQTSGHQNIGTRYVPDHALLAGVMSFDGGSESFRAPINQLAPEALRIADWTDGKPLVAAKELADMGRRVDLNFYPPSSDVEARFWLSSTDGDVMLANALTWAAVPEPATLSLLALGGLAMLRRRRAR